MLKVLPDWLPPRAGAYRVGGCVRDLLLGRAPADYDVAFLGPPAEYAMELASIVGGRVVEIGKPAFRIWRVAARSRFVDMAAVAGRSISDDLPQLDFTVKALAVDTPAGTFIDIAGGRQEHEHRPAARSRIAVGNYSGSQTGQPLFEFRRAMAPGAMGSAVKLVYGGRLSASIIAAGSLLRRSRLGCEGREPPPHAKRNPAGKRRDFSLRQPSIS
jgi:hypothetical protein